jgi:hypothetical protein
MVGGDRGGGDQVSGLCNGWGGLDVVRMIHIGVCSLTLERLHEDCDVTDGL